ncbi:MAG: polyprenyl synthetase family protein [Verrucomicrobiae bacterium]|nr:polyprenyl synthetase family protein [Verrucomicrobiae bacterium]
MPNPPEKSLLDIPAKADLKSVLAGPLEKLTSFLSQQVDDFEEQIRFLVRTCLQNSGKRIRPSLVFLSGDTTHPETLTKLVRLSAVVEMVHIATLVHDDILDGANKRRGQPTICAEYGEHTAVLLGDALFSHALHMASQFETVEVCRFVSRSTRRVCSGEILQTFRRGDWKIPMQDYLEMLDMKTGELFSVSTFLGGKLSGYSHEVCNLLKNFGSQLGIAYQAYDDLTDFIGDESKIGKTLGTDLVTGKATLPLIQLFQLKNNHLTGEMTEALKSGNRSNVRRILLDNGIYDAGINFVSSLWIEAVQTLALIPDELLAKRHLASISQLLREKLDELANQQVSV